MTYVKAKFNTAFSPMKDPIDRRPLHIGIVLLVGGQSKRMGCMGLKWFRMNILIVDKACP